MAETFPEGGKPFTVTRVFKAPIEQVWKAWSEPDYVRRWWGPKGFTSPLAKMDFREGGTSLVCMRAPVDFGGQDMYNTWTYSTIDPHNRIEFTANFSDKHGAKLAAVDLGLPAWLPKDVRTVVTFREIGGEETEMIVTEYGYVSEQALDISKAGLEQCLDKMTALFDQHTENK